MHNLPSPLATHPPSLITKLPHAHLSNYFTEKAKVDALVTALSVRAPGLLHSVGVVGARVPLWGCPAGI